MNHCFPSLESQTGAEEGPGDACALFQPLHSPAAGDSEAESPNRESTQHTPRMCIEEAHAKGFQNGLSAGKSEAIRMAEVASRPVLKGFAENLHRTSESINALAQESAGQSIQYALEMAERILCSKVGLAHGPIRDMQSALNDLLATAYRLTIVMNPDDRTQLEQLIAMGAIEWSYPAAIQIQSATDQPAGEIKAISNDTLRQELEQQIDMVFSDSIQPVSTK